MCWSAATFTNGSVTSSFSLSSLGTSRLTLISLINSLGAFCVPFDVIKLAHKLQAADLLTHANTLTEKRPALVVHPTISPNDSHSDGPCYENSHEKVREYLEQVSSLPGQFRRKRETNITSAFISCDCASYDILHFDSLHNYLRAYPAIAFSSLDSVNDELDQSTRIGQVIYSHSTAPWRDTRAACQQHSEERSARLQHLFCKTRWPKK